MRCRCDGSHRYYSVRCPDVAEHGRWADLPPLGVQAPPVSVGLIEREQRPAPVAHGKPAAGWSSRRVVEPEAEPELLPEPEVRAVVVAVDDARVPAPARRFALVATSTGWDVRVSYARGPVQGRSGWRIVDSVLVVARKPGRRVAAEWIDGSADRGAVLGLDGGQVVKVTDAKAALAVP